MKKLLLLLITLITFTNVSYASFPVEQNTQTEIVSEIPNYGNRQSIWGILSLTLAVIGIILLFTPNIGTGLLLHLLAIIFGAIGFNKDLKGLAISGFVLSLISLLVFALYILLLIAGAGGMGAAFGG